MIPLRMPVYVKNNYFAIDVGVDLNAKESNTPIVEVEHNE